MKRGSPTHLVAIWSSMWNRSCIAASNLEYFWSCLLPSNRRMGEFGGGGEGGEGGRRSSEGVRGQKEGVMRE